MIGAVPQQLDAEQRAGYRTVFASIRAQQWLDAQLQLRAEKSRNGPVFCAGEMLNWEAPTGGYLLTACFSTGCVAGQGVLGHFQLPYQIKPAVDITF